MPISALSLAVVGANFPNAKGPSRRFGISLCEPGTLIELRLEPKNSHDEHAVAVYGPDEIQLGYLTAERAPWIGGMMRAGREVQVAFQVATEFGAYVRAAFDGAEPVLPAREDRESRQDAADHDPDFWPDEAPADDF